MNAENEYEILSSIIDMLVIETQLVGCSSFVYYFVSVFSFVMTIYDYEINRLFMIMVLC